MYGRVTKYYHDRGYGFIRGDEGDTCETEIDGKTWETLDISHSTRDSSVVHGKIDYLVAVMEQYFKGKKTAA